MKKVLLAIAVIATVACFSSCAKKCNCTIAGVEAEYNLEDLQETYKSLGITIDKCTDLNVESVVVCK